MLRGSRAEGFSDKGVPTRPDSDWDIGIADPELFEKAKNARFNIKSPNTNPRTYLITADAMETELGVANLPGVFATLAYLDTAQRLPTMGPVTYVIYKDYHAWYNVAFAKGKTEELLRPGSI
jgi:hypothetical protein